MSATTRQLERGTAAIQTVLSTVVFNIGPSLFDIAAASVYVAAELNTWVAIIVFVTMASYIPITVRPTFTHLCLWIMARAIATSCKPAHQRPLVLRCRFG